MIAPGPVAPTAKKGRGAPREGVDHAGYLLRLAELELLDRERRLVERRIRRARFPAVKSLDSFDFAAIPSLNKMLELARCEYIARRENVIALGNCGTGKTYVALGLGLSACQRSLAVGFTTAGLGQLVHFSPPRRYTVTPPFTPSGAAGRCRGRPCGRS